MLKLIFQCLVVPVPGLFLFLLIIISSSFPVISQNLNSERSILLNFKQQLGNPPSIQSWNSSSSPCDWKEVECTGSAVTGISLSNKNITKRIPASICNLSNLTLLDLSYNYIPGYFPEILLNCSKLEHLDLSQNYFVGPIPDDIHRFSRLRYLDLTANNFSGDIPAAIGRLRELRYLSLVQNEFNGTWPVEIGNLANLEYLAMADNDKFVPSTIPEEFCALKKLKFLWMTEANLIGEIPESFNNLSSLEQLDLSINELNGTIPGGMLMLKNLSILYLYRNRLSGHIPSSVGALNLKEIDLSDNRMTGPIPQDFGKLQNLMTLNLFWNQLSGEIPANIALLPTLENFKVFANKLSGVLPPEFGLHSNIQRFEVSDNQLIGELPQHLCVRGSLLGLVASDNILNGKIPTSLGNCSSLRTLQLSNNNFSGEMPKSLGNCTSLFTIDLANNSFSGEVASHIWTLPSLMTLLLSNNSLCGKFPGKLGGNLWWLDISNNKFYDSITAEISSAVSLRLFKASNNLLGGKFPVELTGLSYLSALFLDGNQFSGELPSVIISWKSLYSLNLARNQLSGVIPKALGSLPTLTFLDLSANQFSGQIPSEFGHFIPNSLNLSNNKLSGKIPRQLEMWAYENSFLNNPKLCADIPIMNRCHARGHDFHQLSTEYLAMIIALTVAGFLVVLFFTCVMLRGSKGREQGHNLGTWKLTPFQRLDFTEADILSSLTENNLIGSGGSGKVYRISINHSGEFVAVKRIWSNTTIDQNLEKQFIAEVQILGTIRHSNIVKLLCCISNESSKLLVYEYMENQSLDEWLHGEKRALSLTSSGRDIFLDWPTRLQIGIGAAKGLCYMHHDCSPPIIHRDVKSSNILLDSEFNARIADFGLAKVLCKKGDIETMSAVAGSFGYLAPEYAYTRKANEKIDVYSFGVVILELTTGREANRGNEHMSLAQWAWQHFGEEKPIVEALDKEIVEENFLEEMSIVFKLGLMCTSNVPSARPSMKEVLLILARSCPQQV